MIRSSNRNMSLVHCQVLIAQSQERERDKLMRQKHRGEDAGAESLVSSSSSPNNQGNFSGGTQGKSRTASISLGCYHPVNASGAEGNSFAADNHRMPILSLAIPLPLFHFGHPSWASSSSWVIWTSSSWVICPQCVSTTRGPGRASKWTSLRTSDKYNIIFCFLYILKFRY